jgi:basic membrane lipoprotein Med (substrate-binding protein (PBP1-ABC) superfamily)
MRKISEMIDLSKRVLDIDIESPVFNAMLNDLDEEIQRVVKSVYNGEFASGEISLKLELKIRDAYKEIPSEDIYGNIINEKYEYKKPNFEHKITPTLKKQYNSKGSYEENKEVVWDKINEKFVVQPLMDPQIKFMDFDISREEGQGNE